MSWSDFVTIAPFVAVVLVAAAVIVVDIIVPGSRRAAIATALVGLAITAVVTALTGKSRATAFGDQGDVSVHRPQLSAAAGLAGVT